MPGPTREPVPGIFDELPNEDPLDIPRRDRPELIIPISLPQREAAEEERPARVSTTTKHPEANLHVTLPLNIRHATFPRALPRPEPMPCVSVIAVEQKMRQVGTLSPEERRQRVERYWAKKRRRTWGKRIAYDCRKAMAERRLRVRGRFVTREQAYAMLGTTAENLTNNPALKELVSANSSCSIVASDKNIKIRNIQALFQQTAGQTQNPVNSTEPERTMHVRRLPRVTVAIFTLRRSAAARHEVKHRPYHVDIARNGSGSATPSVGNSGVDPHREQ